MVLITMAGLLVAVPSSGYRRRAQQDAHQTTGGGDA